MRTRQVGVGVTAWPIAGVLWLFTTTREWDMPAWSVVGVAAVVAGAFGLFGLLIWLPMTAAITRRLASSRFATVVAVGAIGLGPGAFVATVIAVASGNAVWPETGFLVARLAGAAVLASLAGWVIVLATQAPRYRRESARVSPS